ncbi:GNAT family N-acetyltransferase [Mucilaginibacter sp. BJC16-A38]|uniref:GNAT family N-acetyltransferase n=1 Tax=Mucilaginibacter phenanthrenivorans TaxID=1234842 RepID=UPI0021581367|nr:GNAT family N-acetyltransferase [Mucilaginibacter phenanthrenivorans]MCR8561921.1 GNAT family N-acetyltransferase [Mucilaginibacter phenanthrenivorans]
MIKFISLYDLLPIRNEVLRAGQLTLEECIFPSDNLPGIFHLGYYVEEELACIGSFHPQSYDGFEGTGYQLRGMATIEKYRGRGLGNQLLNFAIVYLRGQKANYLWCNARKTALQFYLNMGFEIISAEFEVPGIGPHYVMYVKIR